MTDEISGVLPVYKESGMTSHDVVNKIRRLYGTKKVGHSGTLDPMATGVLPVMIGRAAKAAEFLGDGKKGYLAQMRLGITTDTEDINGKILSQTDILPTKEEVFGACRDFVGEIYQIPPMYSAIKIGGRKLVDMARKGIEIPREARKIEIYSIEPSVICEENGIYRLSVMCSKGTYIRTLCADIGNALGSGAVMSALERTYSGGFGISQCTRIGELLDMEPAQRTALLLPTESLFSELRAVILPEFFAHLAHSGCEIYTKKIGLSADAGELVRLCDKDGFFALGEVREFDEGRAVKPIRQFRLD